MLTTLNELCVQINYEFLENGFMRNTQTPYYNDLRYMAGKDC